MAAVPDDCNVYRTGSSSWRFGHDDLHILHRALFVRDAAMLPVTASAEVPPRLISDVPATPAVVPEADRAAAAQQWLRWWRRMLGQAAHEVSVRRAEDPGQDVLTRIKARTIWQHEICDPPDFVSLSAAPELRSAAVATHAAYQAWSAGPGRKSAPEHEFFPWQLVHDAAHEAAASLGRPVSDMDAVAHVLAVQGRWSYLAGAGCGVCSAAVARDPAAAGELLLQLFVSSSPAAA